MESAGDRHRETSSRYWQSTESFAEDSEETPNLARITMREHEKIAARLASLEGSSTAPSGDQANTTTLQGRLKALAVGRVPPEGAEKDLNSRLASLAVERDSTSPSAEDLNGRLFTLATRGSTLETQTQQHQQHQYVVPEVSQLFPGCGWNTDGKHVGVGSVTQD